jgi:hypothetical protein
MNSLKEKMSGMKRITIEADEEFVLEIVKNGLTLAELAVNVADLEYNASTGKSRVRICTVNPKGFGTNEVTSMNPYNNTVTYSSIE